MNTNEPLTPKASGTPRQGETDFSAHLVVGPCKELAITCLDQRDPDLSAFLKRHWLQKHLRDPSNPC